MKPNNLSNITEHCQYLLEHYPAAERVREYLDGRIGRESQQQFQFGWMPNLEYLSVLTDLIDLSVLQEEKIVFTREISDPQSQRTGISCYFENHPLVMPFKDPYGNVVGLVGRTLLTEEEFKAQGITKYKNTLDFTKGNYVFGLWENKTEIMARDVVYLVEGQFDIIKAKESGFGNVVAMGTSTVSAYQFATLTRYTNNLIILFDNDEAGEKGRKLVDRKYGSLAHITHQYVPQPYHDVDDYLKSNTFNYDDLLNNNYE